MNPLRVFTGLLSLVMLVFPVVYVYKELANGVIFVSIPLFAMFAAGIVGLFLVATNSGTWKKYS